MLEQLNRINLLYDFYAPLLTERQQEALQLYFSDNYSLGEIADHYKVSRQAVHDLIRRSLDVLEKFESKLGLCRLFNDQQELLAEADEILRGNLIREEQVSRLRAIIADLRSGSEQ